MIKNAIKLSFKTALAPLKIGSEPIDFLDVEPCLFNNIRCNYCHYKMVQDARTAPKDTPITNVTTKKYRTALTVGQTTIEQRLTNAL